MSFSSVAPIDSVSRKRNSGSFGTTVDKKGKGDEARADSVTEKRTLVSTTSDASSLEDYFSREESPIAAPQDTLMRDVSTSLHGPAVPEKPRPSPLSSSLEEEVVLVRGVSSVIEQFKDVPLPAIVLARAIATTERSYDSAAFLTAFQSWSVESFKTFCTTYLTSTKGLNSAETLDEFPELTPRMLESLKDKSVANRIIAKRSTVNSVIFFLTEPYSSMVSAPGRTAFEHSKLVNVDGKRLSYSLSLDGKFSVYNPSTGGMTLVTRKQFMDSFMDAGLGKAIIVDPGSTSHACTQLFYLCYTVKTTVNGTTCTPNAISMRLADLYSFKSSKSVTTLLAVLRQYKGINRNLYSVVYAHFSKNPIKLISTEHLPAPPIDGLIKSILSCAQIVKGGPTKAAYDGLKAHLTSVSDPLTFAPYVKAAASATAGMALRPIVNRRIFRKIEEDFKIIVAVRAISSTVKEVLSDDPRFVSLWLASFPDGTAISTDRQMKLFVPPEFSDRVKDNPSGKGIFVHSIRSTVRNGSGLTAILTDILGKNAGSSVLVMDKALQISDTFLSKGVTSIVDSVLAVIFKAYPKCLKLVFPTTRFGYFLHAFPGYGRAILTAPTSVTRAFYYHQAKIGVQYQHALGEHSIKSILSGRDPVSPLASLPLYATLRKVMMSNVRPILQVFFAAVEKKDSIHAVERMLEHSFAKDKKNGITTTFSL